MKSFFLSLSLITFFVIGKAQPNLKLTPRAEISLLTCYPGYESWQAYGHSALRIKDDSFDIVYNYGTFDFSVPNFNSKFLRGKLPYSLSLCHFNEFMEDYHIENRTVLEQTINLSFEKKQKIFNFLIWNAQPENREYYYDFVYNNCCTKIRDLFKEELKPLQYKDAPKPTLRQMLDPYNDYNEWQDLGIDLLLGARLDKIPDPYIKMFLPIDLQNAFDLTPNLIEKENTLFEAKIMPAPIVKITPGLVFWILFICLLIFAIRRGNGIPFGKIGPFIVLFFTGLIGCILLFMWFGTDHLCTKINLNLLWAMPFNLFFAFFVFKPKLPNIISHILRFYRIILILTLIFWTLIPQQFHQSLIPIILIIILFISTILPLQNEKVIK
jgi:hypothetical protein